MNKQKILFVRGEFLPYEIPFLNDINKEFDIELLITRWNYRDEKKFDIGKLNYSKIPFFKFFKYYFTPTLLYKLLTKKYDILIAYDPHLPETWLSFFISKLLNKKFILHTVTWDWPRRPASKLISPIIQLMSKKSTKLWAVGIKSKEQLIKLGADPNDVYIIPLPAIKYEVKEYNKKINELQKKTNIKDKKIILYLCRIVRYKGLDYLINAFSEVEKKHKDTFLLIAGTGEFKEETEKLAKKLKIKNIYFTGKKVEEDEKGFYLSLADVYVLPSTFRDNDGEAWGTVLNEAMELGKPVISTDAVGGAYDLIENGKNGYMVKHGSVEELKNAIEKVISNDKIRKKMGEESKKIINEKFSYKQTYLGFRKLINSLSQ